MEVYYDIPTVRKALRKIILADKTIGLVPTMGALHQGHLSLIEASIEKNDLTVATIFVNPIQFNNHEDLLNYPSTQKDDLKILEAKGCDIVFVPSVKEMYPLDPILKISFGNLENTLEGVHRPGHFNGVALVVLKLLNIIQPSRAYFGQKDFQQFKVIEQLVDDVSLNVTPVMMPIVRENSGLALSSRNLRLSISGKDIASNIYKALNISVNNLKNGSSVNNSLRVAKEYLAKYNDITIEYLTLVNYKDLSVVETSIDADPLVLCFAGYVEGIRLIDNIIIEIEKNEN